MNNTQVAHKWATRNGGSGRGSNFYFEGPTLYSYGPHYPLACWTDVVTPSGFPIVLENSRGWGNTTAKHHNHMHNALHGLTARVIRVPNVSAIPSHPKNVAHMESCFNVAIGKASRARKNADWYIKDARNAQQDARDYCAAFGLELPAFASAEISDDLLARARDAAKRDAAARAEKKRQHEARQAEEYAERMAKWRAGWAVALWSYGGPTELRMMGGRVQTSRGAEVTARAARLLFYVVRDARGQSADVRRDAVASFPDIDGFRVREIDAAGNITIGCHSLTWTVIEAFATAQGWTA